MLFWVGDAKTPRLHQGLTSSTVWDVRTPLSNCTWNRPGTPTIDGVSP